MRNKTTILFSKIRMPTQAEFIAHLRSHPPKSFYDMSGLPRTASAEEIRKAYRKLSLLLHPDKGGDEELFKLLGSLYERVGKGAPEAAPRPAPPPPPKKESYKPKTTPEDFKDVPFPEAKPKEPKPKKERKKKAPPEDIDTMFKLVRDIYKDFIALYTDADGDTQKETARIEKALAAFLNKWEDKPRT